uniref:Uncharacterized protein n=1 Tax=Arundo donax TaxID=35708 RepID=A0A0A8XTA2_ARUDO
MEGAVFKHCCGWKRRHSSVPMLQQSSSLNLKLHTD